MTALQIIGALASLAVFYWAYFRGYRGRA